jgi:phenylalanyl-tRNA synthetase alpha chain
MLEQVKRLQREIEIYTIQNVADLEAFRLQFIAKKGLIAQLFSQFKAISPAFKKELGKSLNDLKEAAQHKYDTYSAQFKQPESPILNQEDLTLPPPGSSLGALHPLTLVKHQILNLFEKIGFSVAQGPEIEDDWHNFEALNFPTHHPAREMMDTFFLSQGGTKQLLRTHTTSVQIQVAEKQEPPIRAITVGRVYRKETISARAHCIFHQVDGFYINKHVSFVDFKQTLLYFIKGLFGQDIAMRLRPSYFPFTEPSAEVDINCRVCQGQGCHVCKYSGWVEIMGGGMIDPAVLQNCQIAPTVYSGFAFGMGLERIAMLLYELNDLRLFTENDIRFLKQFIAHTAY